MSNEQLLEKLSKDMKMRNFSDYTYDSYIKKKERYTILPKRIYRC